MCSAGNRTRVLVVDDSEMNTLMLEEGLRDRFDVVAVSNGPAALEAAATEPQPEVILLDILMPDMDGFEVCKQLKQDKRTQDIPVIFATAMDMEWDVEQGLGLGGADYLTKPFNLSIVEARVRQQLEHRRLWRFVRACIESPPVGLTEQQRQMLDQCRSESGSGDGGH